MDRLLGLPPGGVAVIVSPAGYGATCLLALAAEASGGPVVWLSCRGSSGSADSVVRQLAEGLRVRRRRRAGRAHGCHELTRIGCAARWWG